MRLYLHLYIFQIQAFGTCSLSDLQRNAPWQSLYSDRRDESNAAAANDLKNNYALTHKRFINTKRQRLYFVARCHFLPMCSVHYVICMKLIICKKYNQLLVRLAKFKECNIIIFAQCSALITQMIGLYDNRDETG